MCHRCFSINTVAIFTPHARVAQIASIAAGRGLGEGAEASGRGSEGGEGVQLELSALMVSNWTCWFCLTCKSGREL